MNGSRLSYDIVIAGVISQSSACFAKSSQGQNWRVQDNMASVEGQEATAKQLCTCSQTKPCERIRTRDFVTVNSQMSPGPV